MKYTEKQVIDILCKKYEINRDDIFSTSRVSRNIYDVKKLLAKWYHDILCIGINDITIKMNFKNDSSSKRSVKYASDLIDTDSNFAKNWYQISGEFPMKNRKHEKEMLHSICSTFSLSKLQLKTPSHIPNIATAKQLVVKWYKDVGGLSYPQIAKKMCYCDHTSAMHAYTRCAENIDTELRIKKIWFRLPSVDIYPKITSLKYKPC